MLFVVKFRNGEASQTNRYPHAVLTQDAWDDYGYRTTFHVVLHLSSSDHRDLGNIKIIETDRTSGPTQMPREPFTSLSDDHASLGADMEYYETLFRLGPAIFRPFLEGLRDVAYSEDARIQVEDTEAFSVSLTRFSGAERTLQDAARLMRSDSQLARKRKSAGFRFKFRTRVASGANSFVAEFDFKRRATLPNRINALIGYNGTGKTQLLSNLAIVASGYGYSTKEELLRNAAGRFVETAPPFKTVVVISYSAFDTFVIPGRTEVEKRRLERDGDIFGYVYCGLRERAEDGPHGEQVYRLRTPQEIEGEFLKAFRRVRDNDRLEQLVEVLKPLLRDASFERIGLTQLFSSRDPNDLVDLFRSLSSGHKVVLKIVVELTAHIAGTTPTLVLIDEPETHLHPPLLAAFLKSLRVCLDAFDGFALISTHSPVVLQETPARYVRVLRRTGDRNTIGPTTIETFGESIGVITQEVFNLGDGSTDWHETLSVLAGQRDIEAIEKMFGRELGFAARSYILSVQDDAEG